MHLNRFIYIAAFLLLAAAGVAQYPIYFCSGNWNPPASWNQGSAVQMGTVANTNIEIGPATVIGNCYFRFYSALSGGVDYAPAGDADSLVSTNAPFPLVVSGGFGKSYYIQTQDTTSNYVFKTTGSGAPGNARAAVIEVQGPIQSVDSMWRVPANTVYAGQQVNVYATTTDTLSPGQGVYLRYTTDNWATSTVLPMAGSGTLYYVQLPAFVNTADAWVNYYIFTSGSGLTIDPSDADLMTINLYNNGYLNFSYVPQCVYELSNPVFKMLQTDKARYNPGDTVHFLASLWQTFSDTSTQLEILCIHDDEEAALLHVPIGNSETVSWSWVPPLTDYTGYLVSVKVSQAPTYDSTSIAVDVSSDWAKFPRYGFVSAYPETDSSDRANLFAMLNRYHLNGLQFYDVNHKHDVPLAGSVAQPDTEWNDIANRHNYYSTVQAYIGLAHSCNMNAMNYNLIYGAYANSEVADGVLPQWGLYYDTQHQNQVEYRLPANWASNLAVEVPQDTGWQNFIFNNEQNLFDVFAYDGWHVDQLGSQGTVYDYNGNAVDLPTGFGSFLPAAKGALNKRLVMNAVTNYGQPQIAATPVDFLYTEVWPPYVTYNGLAQIIATNNSLGNNQLSTVLAAYMDQNISDTNGLFNTPAVLLTDAAIFALGGSHIELGDHMLCNPYYPNNNLNMTCGLQQNMVSYYDFMTAYENLLRDSITQSPVTLSTTGGYTLSDTAAMGSVWYLSYARGNYTQIFHFINLLSANTLNWNDPNDNQVQPGALAGIPLSFQADSVVKLIYFISPDWNTGVPMQVPFTKTGNTYSCNLPELDIWSTLVVEYAPTVQTGIRPVEACSAAVFPNPFTGQVNFQMRASEAGTADISISDELGEVVYHQGALALGAGSSTWQVALPNAAPGMYYYSVNFNSADGQMQGRQTGKVVRY